MNPFAIIIGFALLVGSVFYVAAPFRLDEKKEKNKKSSGMTQESLLDGHQSAILALRDLDFDFRAGKVSEEDYGSLRTSLLAKAAATMQTLDESADARLEMLIQARRTQQTASATPARLNANAAGVSRCANCHEPLAQDANFCMKCGTPVQRTFCPHCGKAILVDDRFCPTCGKAIPQITPTENR